MRFEIAGMVDDKPVIVVEHVTRLRGDLRPDWAQPPRPGGSTASRSPANRPIPWTSAPPAAMATTTRSYLRCGGPDRQRHPAVVAAPPGIRTTLDLPLVSSVNRFGVVAR